ncbi:hypothetical protein LTR50_002030 [Elasticomyces elasticus]|nr:hypothetical protein LTR50_002030 [Elasticomyces elasticus]
MPSAVPRRDVLSIPSWRTLQCDTSAGNHFYSTLIEPERQNGNPPPPFAGGGTNNAPNGNFTGVPSTKPRHDSQALPERRLKHGRNIISGSTERQRNKPSTRASKRVAKPTPKEDPICDVDYVRTNYPYPKPEDYPGVPDAMWTDIGPAAILHNHFQLKEYTEAEYEFSQHPLSQENPQFHKDGQDSKFRCVLNLGILSMGQIEGIGEGLSKQRAKHAAWHHVVSQLHISGYLAKAFPDSGDAKKMKNTRSPDSQKSSGASTPHLLQKDGRSQPEVLLSTDKQAVQLPQQLDAQTLEEESTAKLDIYNYAASFGLVPHFEASAHKVVQPPRQPQGRRARGPPQKGPTIKVIRVAIKLPQQHIDVSATGKTLKTAEIAAALEFKRAAERYFSENEDEISALQKSHVLTTDNVPRFFDFIKIIRPHTNIEIEHEQLLTKHLGHNQAKAQLMINNEPVGEPVLMLTKKQAAVLAHLTAAVQMTVKEPSLATEFHHQLQIHKGNILRPVSSVAFPVDPEALILMRNSLYDVRGAGLPDVKPEITADLAGEDARGARKRHRLNRNQVEQRSAELRERQDAFEKDPTLEGLRQKKADLPMNQYRAQVLDLVGNNMYSIVVGATGSGKTTQVPQILVEEAIAAGTGGVCNIICTQPRRIAATSVAQRVAVERNEQLRDSVGYHVRFDAKLPQTGGSITYCTTGILLEQLKHFADDIFDTTSHIIVDEVHERDMNIDFLLIILKKAIKARQKAGKSVPKVVLMSATLDTELFANYFAHTTNEWKVLPCPSLSVPGRIFPVKEKFFDDIMHELDVTYPGKVNSLFSRDKRTQDYVAMERNFSSRNTADVTGSPETESIIDWKRERQGTHDDNVSVAQEREEQLVPLSLVAATVAHIANTSIDGAILVFLPGLDEILKTDTILREDRPLGVDFRDTSRFKISFLHSSVPREGQAEVFEAVPQGCRKVILSTNIAETSVTIPDVQYVVDAGKLREKRYDQLRRITKLATAWVSKSNSKQRAGRAGRVQNGNYYALFSRARFESLRAVGLPELLRSDLQETCLSIKAQKYQDTIQDFLAQAIESPDPEAIEAATANLKSLETFTENEELTALGRLLSKLPVHPTLGKMIVLGVIFRCLDPMVILGASAEERPIFVSPIEARQEATRAHRVYGGPASDHIALISAFKDIRHTRDSMGNDAAWRLAKERYLNMPAFRTIDQTTTQIGEILVDAGLIPKTTPWQRSQSQIGHPSLNKNAGNIPLLKALVLAGYHPNLGVSGGAAGNLYRTPGEQKAMIHPSSVNYGAGKGASKGPSGLLMAYTTLAKSVDGRSLFLRDTTLTTPLMAALFGGKLKQTDAHQLTMDEWLPLHVRSDYDRKQATKIVLEYRKALDRVLGHAFQSLSSLEAKDQGYLADDPLREVFASELVDVLDRDVPFDQRSYPAPPSGRATPQPGQRAQREYPARGEQRDQGLRAAASKPSWRGPEGMDRSWDPRQMDSYRN